MKNFFDDEDFPEDNLEDIFEEDFFGDEEILKKRKVELESSLRREHIESLKRQYDEKIPKEEIQRMNLIIPEIVKESLGIVRGDEDLLERELNQEIFEWITS